MAENKQWNFSIVISGVVDATTFENAELALDNLFVVKNKTGVVVDAYSLNVDLKKENEEVW